MKCVDIYGVDPNLIKTNGKNADAFEILQFARAANPSLYWILAATPYGTVFWYGTVSCMPPNTTNFPGAVSYPVNPNIYIYENQIYDLTLFFSNGCT